MPTYHYRCLDCGDEWEEQRTIATRDEPVLNSDSCSEAPVDNSKCRIERYLPSPPGMGDPMRLGLKKAPRDFDDILKKIKTKHRHNTITTNY